MHVATENQSAPLARRRTRLRLTRRGRVVFGGFGALLLVGLLSLSAALGAPQALATAEQSETVFGYIVVQPGESLWSLAQQLDRTADPRDVIAEVVRLNQLESSEVYAGTLLAVPMQYHDAPGVIIEAKPADRVNASEGGLAS